MILINSSTRDTLKIFQPFLPIPAPVGIGSLLAFAKRKNVEVKFIDEQIEGNVLGLISEYVKDMQKPYIFGFSVLTAVFNRAVSLSRELKNIYPDSIIVFGGIHPTALPDDVLSYKHIDVVIRGEGENALIDFYRCVKGNKDFTQLDNLSYRKNGAVVHNRISPNLASLDDLPDFPYHLFKSKRYDLGFVLSSRGCPYRCIFCSNRMTSGNRYRYCSAKKIIRNLDCIYRQCFTQKRGKANVIFFDDNLLVNKERVYELLDEIKRNGFDKKFTFGFQARGDNVNHKLLKDLYGSGFRNIFFGLETASEKIMQLIKKDETVAQCVAAVKTAKSIGFNVSATFIYGFPWETHNDRMNCLKLSKELKLDMVRYNNATPYPGTELYEIAKSEDRMKVMGLFENFNSVSVFIENPFSQIPFSYVPIGSSEKEIRNDLLYSYFSFYFNFNKIKNIFIDTGKGTGWFNAGDTVISLIRKLPALLLLGANIFLKFYKLFLSLIITKMENVHFHKRVK